MLKNKFELSRILTEVKEIHVYRNDVVMKRNSRMQVFIPHPIFDMNFKYGLRYLLSPKTKVSISKLSQKSLKELAFVASNTSIDFGLMITLTYPSEFPTNGRSAKYHLKKFIKAMVARWDCSYLWFLEFQKRGAPHFHILISIDNYDKNDIEWVAQRWYKIVDSHDRRHLMAGTRIEKLRSKEGGRHYAVKYAMKAEQKTIPKNYTNVGRFWGHSKDVKPIIKQVIKVLGDVDALDKISDEWVYKSSVAGKIIKVLYNASRYVKNKDD